LFQHLSRANHPFFIRRSSLGQRTSCILKHMFPVPKADSKRIMTFANRSESIQFRHHLYRQGPRPSFLLGCDRFHRKGAGKELELKELGPRFDMKLYQIKQGTVEQQVYLSAQFAPHTLPALAA